MPEPTDEYLRKSLAHRTRLAGAHEDRRTRRRRTRGDRDRWARHEYKEDTNG